MNCIMPTPSPTPATGTAGNVLQGTIPVLRNFGSPPDSPLIRIELRFKDDYFPVLVPDLYLSAFTEMNPSGSCHWTVAWRPGDPLFYALPAPNPHKAPPGDLLEAVHDALPVWFQTVGDENPHFIMPTAHPLFALHGDYMRHLANLYVQNHRLAATAN